MLLQGQMKNPTIIEVNERLIKCPKQECVDNDGKLNLLEPVFRPCWSSFEPLPEGCRKCNTIYELKRSSK